MKVCVCEGEVRVLGCSICVLKCVWMCYGGWLVFGWDVKLGCRFVCRKQKEC